VLTPLREVFTLSNPTAGCPAASYPAPGGKEEKRVVTPALVESWGRASPSKLGLQNVGEMSLSRREYGEKN
jgi:hypothetical protein